MEHDSIERIRTTTFEIARRGYDPRQVEAFLGKLADWLETGGADQARAEAIRRELERVGERTASVLTTAEETANQLRGDAEREIAAMVESAEAEASRARDDADEYAARTRADADGYASKLRGDAEGYSAKTRADADQYAEAKRAAADADAERKQAVADQRAEEVLEAADRKARRIINDGAKRRREIEVVISDLVGARDAAIGEANALAERLGATAATHRPDEGADRFARPRELDPADRGEPVEDRASAEGDDGQAAAEPAERVEA